MSEQTAVLEPPKKSPPAGGDEVVLPQWDDSVAPPPRRVTRWLRLLLRTLGVLVVLAMGAFLVSQHLLPPSIAISEAALAVAAPSGASEDNSKLVVCFGYADLEGGVTTLHPSQPGRVEDIPVQENEDVVEGAVLLRLDDRAARLRVEEAKALLNESTAKLTAAEKTPEKHSADIAKQKVALEIAHHRLLVAQRNLATRRERQRVGEIGKIKEDPVMVEYVAAAVEQVKQVEEEEKLERETLRALELDDPAAQVSRARAEVAAMQARLEQAQQTLEEHTLKAPEAGKVLRIFVARGELLGAQSKKTAIQFCPDRPRVIRAEVDQAFAQRVKAGQPAAIEDDGHAGTTWRGRVSRISDWYTQRRLVAEEQLHLKDVRTLECLVAVDPGQPPLRIGQRVRVTIRHQEP